MARLHTLLAGSLGVFILALMAKAQELPCTSRTVFATAIDREGSPLRGLTAKDFRARFRGKPAEVRSATLDMGPRRIVLVLDASGSMTSGEAWDAATVLAQDLYRFAPWNISFALVIFASKVLRTVGWEERLTLFGTLAALPANRALAPQGQRKTALYDAVARALQLLEPPQMGDVIYVITDGGEDNSSKTERSKIRRQMLGREVRVFSFLLLQPFGRARTLEEASALMALRDLVEETGGGMLELVAAGTLPRFWPRSKQDRAALAAAKRLYQQMGVFYRLELELPQLVDKPRRWNLEVVNEKGKRRHEVSVLYSRHLLPCMSAGIFQDKANRQSRKLE